MTVISIELPVGSVSDLHNPGGLSDIRQIESLVALHMVRHS